MLFGELAGLFSRQIEHGLPRARTTLLNTPACLFHTRYDHQQALPSLLIFYFILKTLLDVARHGEPQLRD